MARLPSSLIGLNLTSLNEFVALFHGKSSKALPILRFAFAVSCQ